MAASTGRYAGGLWGPREFRGSSKREEESGRPQVTVSEDGYGATTGATTRSMRAGPITPGEWAVQLPVAAVVDQTQGDLDGKVAFRVEIDVIDAPEFADEPFRARRPFRGRRHSTPVARAWASAAYGRSPPALVAGHLTYALLRNAVLRSDTYAMM